MVYMRRHNLSTQAEGAHARGRWHIHEAGRAKFLGCTSAGAATPFAAAGIFCFDNNSSADRLVYTCTLPPALQQCHISVEGRVIVQTLRFGSS